MLPVDHAAAGKQSLLAVFNNPHIGKVLMRTTRPDGDIGVFQLLAAARGATEAALTGRSICSRWSFDMGPTELFGGATGDLGRGGCNGSSGGCTANTDPTLDKQWADVLDLLSLEDCTFDTIRWVGR